MYFISKKVGRAVGDYNMIKDKDKILVAVSGGKDSLTLLKLLKYRQSFAPIKFDILAAHIDFGYSKTLPKLLAGFFEKLQVKYYIKKVNIFKDKNRADINCFWCSWNRRKALFELAAKRKFNKVALGHHFDDIIETVLLNLFYQGQISAMKPKQELFDGKITIIRPLAYVEEKETARLAHQLKDFPYQTCDCPSAIDSHRKVIKKIIRELYRSCPHIKKNIFNSIKRIKKDYLL